MKYKILGVILIMTSIGYSQNWKTNFEEAKKEAAEKQLPIVLVFSGSDWCAPCIKLDKMIWQSEEFKAYSATKLIMQRADFPRKKANQLDAELIKQNEALAEIYNREGMFPLVVIMDATGKVLGKTSYKNVSPKEYIGLLEFYLK